MGLLVGYLQFSLIVFRYGSHIKNPAMGFQGALFYQTCIGERIIILLLLIFMNVLLYYYFFYHNK